MRNLIRKSSKYSRRINYDALKRLFDSVEDVGVGVGVGRGMATPPVEVNLDDKEDDLYTRG